MRRPDSCHEIIHSKKPLFDSFCWCQTRDVVQPGRFDIEIPKQRFAAPRTENADIGGKQAAPDAAFVAVEGDDEWCHALFLKSLR